MSLLEQISRWIRDPEPEYIFELSEEGIAYSRSGETGFTSFDLGTLVVSPVKDNFRRFEAAASVLTRAFPLESGKRARAALILPDYCARISILDFDSFPSTLPEQLALVRLRLRNTLPFDADAAAVSLFVQRAPAKKEAGKYEVLAVAVAPEVIARYEALFRGANFHPGEVTISSLAALNLCKCDGVSIIAKLGCETLTLIVVDHGLLKLFRCVWLETAAEAEVSTLIYSTLAYIEDELGTQAGHLLLCGFPAGGLPKVDLPIERVNSELGKPDSTNTGLLGYLEGARRVQSRQ